MDYIYTEAMLTQRTLKGEVRVEGMVNPELVHKQGEKE